MSRLGTLRFAVIAGVAVLVLRLAHLQLLHGAYYRRLAENNRVRVVPEEAPRGLIVDRHEQLLASNRVIFRVAVVPQELGAVEPVLARVSRLVHQPVERLEQALETNRSLAFLPATIVSHIPKATALQLEEEHLSLPGVIVRPETVRDYPLGTTAAHLLGYLGQPTPEELPVLKQYGVRPQHLIGRTGLEFTLDAYLRGRSGGMVVEVDHRTRQVRTLGYRSPTPGQPVRLTIDAQLQTLIEQAFGAQHGAAVVLDPHTGEVLAMVSVPAFSPASFVTGEARDVRRILNDPDAPLMNRATMGAYTPGSIAKVITAGAALERGLVKPSHAMVCQGSLKIGDRVFRCWNEEGHGPLTLPEALMVSCNVYFMQLGRWLGMDQLNAAMSEVGWGRRTGWPLEEAAGTLPQRRLTQGEVAILGIGQGELLVTPLQVAVLAAAMANDGWLVKPWVVKVVGDHPAAKPSLTRIRWSSASREAVRGGMRAVVHQPAGTGYRAFSPAVSIAGKTGTAQTHLPGQTHGWFMGYCPVEAPRVAMAILAEHGGSGGDLPAEIARAICEYIALPESL
jgi:penicillin-binding protein 2